MPTAILAEAYCFHLATMCAKVRIHFHNELGTYIIFSPETFKVLIRLEFVYMVGTYRKAT